MENENTPTTMPSDAFGKEVTIEVLPHGRNDQLPVSICS